MKGTYLGEFQEIVLLTILVLGENAYGVTIRAISFMGIMIVLISILGQLGMALYNAQTRVKEIGIRKVLGARLRTIMTRLLKNTFISLFIAAMIAVAPAFLASQDFMFVSGLSLIVSPMAIARGVLIFAVLIITQTWRIANQNPAESLRYE